MGVHRAADGQDQPDDTAWLRERSPLPLIADESVQRLGDVVKAQGVFDGINIKLMKCTGLREAHQMIGLARALGLKVMLGCMTETSCAISAAAQLSAARRLGGPRWRPVDRERSLRRRHDRRRPHQAG